MQLCQQMPLKGGAVVRGIQKRTAGFSRFFGNVQNKRVRHKFGALVTKLTVNELKQSFVFNKVLLYVCKNVNIT